MNEGMERRVVVCVVSLTSTWFIASRYSLPAMSIAVMDWLLLLGSLALLIDSYKQITSKQFYMQSSSSDRQSGNRQIKIDRKKVRTIIGSIATDSPCCCWWW